MCDKSKHRWGLSSFVCEAGLVILIWTLKLSQKKTLSERSWMAVSKISGRLNWNTGYSNLWWYLENRIISFSFFFSIYTDVAEDTLSNSVAQKIICKAPDLASLGELFFPSDLVLPWKLHFLSCKVVDLRDEAPKSRRNFFLGTRMKLWNALEV